MSNKLFFSVYFLMFIISCITGPLSFVMGVALTFIASLIAKLGFMLIFRDWWIEGNYPGAVYNRKENRIEIIPRYTIHSGYRDA